MRDILVCLRNVWDGELVEVREDFGFALGEERLDVVCSRVRKEVVEGGVRVDALEDLERGGCAVWGWRGRGVDGRAVGRGGEVGIKVLVEEIVVCREER